MCLPNALGKAASRTSLPAWLVALLFCAAVASMSVAGVAAYRWRARRDMRGEIQAIMREYMPLEHGEEELGRGLLGRGGGGGGKIPARHASRPAPAAPREEQDLEYAAPATEMALKPGAGPL